MGRCAHATFPTALANWIINRSAPGMSDHQVGNAKYCYPCLTILLTSCLSLKYLWIGFGWFFVVLGLIGIALPLLPTTPFLLLAAVCFSKGSDNIYRWLINHPTLGPPIVNWREKRAITRRSKIVATLSMLVLLVITPLVGAPWWAAAVQAAVLTVVAIFLWRQAEP